MSIDPDDEDEIRDYLREPCTNLDRLQTAVYVMHISLMLSKHYDAGTIKSWFLGMEPLLEDENPLIALMKGRFKDVRLAATSFIAHG